MSEMYEATLVGQPFPQFERFPRFARGGGLAADPPENTSTSRPQGRDTRYADRKIVALPHIRSRRVGAFAVKVKQYTVVQPFANELHRCEPNPSNTRQYLPEFRVRRQSETSIRGPANREVRKQREANEWHRKQGSYKNPPTESNAPRKERLLSGDNPEPKECPASSTIHLQVPSAPWNLASCNHRTPTLLTFISAVPGGKPPISLHRLA